MMSAEADLLERQQCYTFVLPCMIHLLVYGISCNNGRDESKDLDHLLVHAFPNWQELQTHRFDHLKFLALSKKGSLPSWRIAETPPGENGPDITVTQQFKPRMSHRTIRLGLEEQ